MANSAFSPVGVFTNSINIRTATVGCTAANVVGLSTGQVQGYVTCPYSGVISAWDIAVNTGSITFQTWKVATGTSSPTSSNSISSSGVSLTSGTAIHSAVLTDFTTTTVTAGDIFGFNISAVSGGVNIASFQLEITKNS